MQTNRDKTDILVIGGGPAGAAAATWLARAGFQVTLLDRACFPRDKACGEFLTSAARDLMHDLGVWETLINDAARPVQSTVLIAPNGRQMRHAPANGEPTGYACRRVTLDAALLETARNAGVEVREGFAVRELLREANGAVRGIRGNDAQGEPAEFRSRLVIGADGAHSLVARQLGMVRALPRLQRLAVISHWQNVSGPNDTIEMRTSSDIVCGMDFPGPNASANMTLVIPTSQASRIAGRAGDWVEEIVQTRFPDLAERLQGAQREPTVRTIGCFGHVCKPAVADGALLVGDAAAFIDPFTGEGVYFALRGAQLAAEVITKALHIGDTSRACLWPYHQARQELSRRYMLCDLVQAVVRAPHLLNSVVKRLSRRSGLADRLLSILGDTRPVTDALHPAFLWQLLAPEI